jgi:hypothetical protein
MTAFLPGRLYLITVVAWRGKVAPVVERQQIMVSEGQREEKFSPQDEGTTWIHGHYPDDSEENRALLAAWLLKWK